MGIISRAVVTVTPPATLYTIEQPGRELGKATEELGEWGEGQLAERHQ